LHDHGHRRNAEQQGPGPAFKFRDDLLLVPDGGFCVRDGLGMARWTEDYHLFILGALSFAAASWGRTALRRRWWNWVRLHVMGMGASYILLLTAFYVDNGKNLPLWKELPQIAFWLLPSAVGVPIITYALLRHPLVRRFQR
jgi:hypothetical protein